MRKPIYHLEFRLDDGSFAISGSHPETSGDLLLMQMYCDLLCCEYGYSLVYCVCDESGWCCCDKIPTK